jgi:predicted dehydrogenase
VGSARKNIQSGQGQGGCFDPSVLISRTVRYRSDWGNPTMASYDGDPVLGDPEVDTAVIATSTDTHADLIHRAARCR